LIYSRIKPFIHAALFGLSANTSPALAASHDPLAVHGDSTAQGSRIDGISVLWNLFPRLDGIRWWNQLARSYNPPRAVFNDGAGGQTIVALREKMEKDFAHRRDMTIIYDRRNSGETPEFYIATLDAALATMQTRHFLIMPQVGWATVKDEDWAVIQDINRRIVLKWPLNTFSPRETASFEMALASPSTRIDGLHRNAIGQAIEAGYIKAWIDARGW
jgi:hypothetical protein